MKWTNIEQYASNYSKTELLTKVQNTAKRIGVKTLYAVLVLYYAVNSPQISMQEKAKIYGALGYFILPIDLLPDMIPFAGYADDWAALLYVIKQVYEQITPEIKQRAREQLVQWFGPDIAVEEFSGLSHGDSETLNR